MLKFSVSDGVQCGYIEVIFFDIQFNSYLDIFIEHFYQFKAFNIFVWIKPNIVRRSYDIGDHRQIWQTFGMPLFDMLF